MLKLTNIDAYYGYVHALKNISIEVPEGKIVTLLGSNGAGKTSTLKVISGLLKPREGSITLKDKEISSFSAEEIVSMGIVQSPEGRQIFPEFTVLENLKAGAYTLKDKNNFNIILQRVYNYFPILKEREKQIAGTLSGGEQQMLALGRGLMARAKLMLLDEPSMGLAPLLVQDIFRVIRQVNSEGTTILLVEQNAHMALEVAHRAYVLETGNIILEGPAHEVAKNPKVIKAYLG